eukprot:SAG25_NODE_201_length_11995_cov_74.743695_4_plen_100_part_00
MAAATAIVSGLAALGRSGLLKSPLQSSARPILENYGCRWNESWIKVLCEAGEQDIEVDEKTLKAAVAVDDGLVTAVICSMREAGLAYVKAPFEADHRLD